MKKTIFLSIALMLFWSLATNAQTLDVDNSTGGAGDTYGMGDGEGQSFTCGATGKLDHIDLYLKFQELIPTCASADVQITLKSGDGLGGADIASSNVVTLTPGVYEWHTFTFPTQPNLTATSKYTMVFSVSSCLPMGFGAVYLFINNSTYTDGQYYTVADEDQYFRTYMIAPPAADIVWEGPAPGAWSNVTGPTAGDNAIIDWLYNENANIVCNDLTINAGRTISIQPGQSVTVNGNLTNNGTLELASSADMTVSGSLITLGTIDNTSGTMRANRYLHPDSWHFVSSPLNANVNAEDPFYLEYVYTYDEAYAGTENDDAWIALSAGDQIQPGVGYLVMSPTDWNTNSYVSFEGTFNTGNVSITNLPRTNTLPDKAGFNLVANPYPSAINFDAVSKTNISNTMYIWNSEGNLWSTGFAGYGTWDGTTGTTLTNGEIPPMQAFIVEALVDNSNSINFDNGDRVHTANNFREDNEVQNLIRLKTSGNNYIDEAVVYFADDNEDSKKLFGPAYVPSIYTMEDDQKIVINKLQDLRGEYSVPMGFVCDENGEYTISITEYTFDENSTVILEDTHTGTFTTLVADTEYTFAYDTNDDELRFVLHFNKSATSILENASNLNIYAYGKSIFVQNIENQNGTVQIFNALGQQVLATDLQTEIATNLESGLYIVKVVNQGVETKQKVIIK